MYAFHASEMKICALKSLQAACDPKIPGIITLKLLGLGNRRQLSVFHALPGSHASDR